MRPSPSRLRACIILTLCLLAAALPARAQETARLQETVRLDGAKWTLTIPQGWERIPDSFLALQNEIVVARAPSKVSPYVLGLWRKDNPQIYALVQPFPDERMNTMTFDDIERVFGAESIAKAQDTFTSSFSDVIKSSSFGQPRLDRDRKRVIVTLSMTDPQGRSSRGVTQGLLWAGGMLNLHAYAPADEFDARLPELTALADNITFDPGQTFEPGSKKKRSGISPAITGGTIGAIVAIAAYRRKKRRAEAQAAAGLTPAPTPPPTIDPHR